MDNRETILQAEKADKRKKMVRNIIVYGFLGVWGFNLSLDESIGILLVSVLIATVIRYVIMQDKRIV